MQAKDILFRPCASADRDACLDIFDANCPAFFAPNERDDLQRFLDTDPEGYELCVVNEETAGAFGLSGTAAERKSLNWILINPRLQGVGIGTAIMSRVIQLCRSSGLSCLDIAASHKSAPFFAKFGANTITVIDDGWGPGMHRMDMELHF